MKNRYIIAVLLLSMTFVSCGKFLDINPKAEVVNKDMFSNKQGSEDAVMGLYGELKTKYLYGEIWSWGVFDVLSQDYSTSETTYAYMKAYNYNDSRKLIDTMWASSYRVVGYANNIIGNLEKRTTDRFELQDLYLGEAYGVRAMLHFDIVRAFAPNVELKGGDRGIPYVREYTFKHTPFSSVSQVYDYLVTDLKRAQELLITDQQHVTYPRADEKTVFSTFLKGREMHFNYYAATALLARVLWTKGDYAGARTEALKVIESGKFPLSSQDEVVNMIAGVLSQKETIWGLYSTSFIEITKERLNTNNSWGSFVPYQVSSGGKYPYPYIKIYEGYINQNAGGDTRLNWFRPGNETSKTNNCLKLVDKTLIGDDKNTPAKRKLLDGISILRVPEMYYIVAEAYIRENNLEQAAKYIDPVLQSRGLTKLSNREPAITPSLDMLYNERHKELYGEGQRFFDMKKRNEAILSNFTLTTLPATDLIYVLPIPESEINNRL